MSSRVSSFMNKYLPMLLGCHCRPDRSFYYKGKKFPVCARCTGEMIGFVAGALTCGFYTPPIYVLVIMLIPLILDGTVQKLTSYESTNVKRLITGLLFGYAIIVLFIVSMAATVRLGFHVGLKIFNK